MYIIHIYIYIYMNMYMIMNLLAHGCELICRPILDIYFCPTIKRTTNPNRYTNI